LIEIGESDDPYERKKQLESQISEGYLFIPFSRNYEQLLKEKFKTFHKNKEFYDWFGSHMLPIINKLIKDEFEKYLGKEKKENEELKRQLKDKEKGIIIRKEGIVVLTEEGVGTEMLREKLKELEVNSSFCREAIIYMYFNDKSLLGKEIWIGMNKDYVITKGKTPDASFGRILRWCCDNTTFAGIKSKNIYFHIEDGEKPQKFILLEEWRKKIDLFL
ncbi:hypothetical protein LCGC14_0937320, partial [marine sediment metagenome]